MNQRACCPWPRPMRVRLAGASPQAALRATAGTAAPAPAAAPRIQLGGWPARKTADSTTMSARPGAMKQTPPRSAPFAPRSSHAQEMASWVEAGRAGGWWWRRHPRTPGLRSIADRRHTGHEATRCGWGARRTRCIPGGATPSRWWRGAPAPKILGQLGRRSRDLVTEDLVSELPELSLGRLERPTTRSGGHIRAPDPTVDDVLVRSEEALGLHLVERGIERPRADPVTVLGQLLRQPRAVYRTVGGVMQDVQSNCDPQEFPDEPTLVDIALRYRFSILLHASPGLLERGYPATPGTVELRRSAHIQE